MLDMAAFKQFKTLFEQASFNFVASRAAANGSKSPRRHLTCRCFSAAVAVPGLSAMCRGCKAKRSPCQNSKGNGIALLQLLINQSGCVCGSTP